MLLTIHLGFMAEEISAKLKPDLHKVTPDRSIIIITRDNIKGNELFEQSLHQYHGLTQAVNNNQYSVMYKDQQCNSLVCHTITNELNTYFQGIELSAFELKDSKPPKLKTEAPPLLTTIHVGKGLITDIYIQFPEMGFQSNLASILNKGILEAVFSWVQKFNDSNNAKYTKILFDSFGAGGSLHQDLLPGSMHTATTVFSIRSFLKMHKFKNVKEYKAKAIIKEYGQINSRMPFFNTNREADFCWAQEVARYFLIDLANTILDEADRIHYELSAPYQNYLREKREPFKSLYQEKQLLEKEDLEIASAATRRGRYSTEELIRQKELRDKQNFIEHEIQRHFDEKIQKLEKELNFLTDEEKKDIIEDLGENGAEHSISFSASMFIDEAMKKAANALFENRITDANMEDDLVAKAESQARKIIRRRGLNGISTAFVCSRVHCDPFSIRGIWGEEIMAWAREARYSLAHYIDAILWGASGFDKRFLTRNAHWTFYDRQDDEQKALFYLAKARDERIVIDPFWREIATDLLADVISEKAFTEACVEDKQPLVTRAKYIKQTLLTANLTEHGLRIEIGNFLEEFLQKNKIVDSVEPERFKVWIRKRSWAGNTAQVLDELEIEPVILDRALYVSTNIPALIRHGEERVKQLDHVKKLVTRLDTGDDINVIFSELFADMWKNLQGPAMPRFKLENTMLLLTYIEKIFSGHNLNEPIGFLREEIEKKLNTP